MVRLLLKTPSYYWKLGENRILRPILWNRWMRTKLVGLKDQEFIGRCGSKDPAADFVKSMHEQVRLRFFFHPRNQKDFFLNQLTKTQDEESILSDAQDVLDNRFDTLGSGKVDLGVKINWHRDFKSGKVWDVKLPSQIDFMDLKNPSDVKVPWELSRFHQVWWLGKAYWLTRDEKYAQKFVQLVDDWIEGNPLGLGVNWAVAMEVAFRATNWIAGYYFFCESKSISEEFWLKFFKNLYLHGVFIKFHLEYSWRSGNHFLSDVVGLIALGIFFRNTSFGKAWISWGTKTLEGEMETQVFADGVDFEKSTSYQRLVIELFYTAAILCSRNNIPLAPTFAKRLENMFEFVQSYLRPDGSIPLFGDADDGRLFRFIADNDINDHRHVLSVGAILFNRGDFKNAAGKFYQDSLWLFGGEGFEKHQMLKADVREPESRAFREGGFYIMRGKDVHVMADAGDIGMGGMGGHGHNDTLSFEYWAKGEPLIVDSGTYAYTFDTVMRQELRSTKSHNTIVVDGKEIATFVGLWMILNDATKPDVLEWKTSDQQDIFEAQHHAYDTVPSPVVHRRRIELDKQTGSLKLRDILDGSGSHLLESYLHFYPGVKLQITDPRSAVVVARHSRYTISADVGEFSLAETWFSPTYGVREKNVTLKLSINTKVPARIQMEITPATFNA
jgi:uncharacterized heparinase superfamily protein